MARYLRSRLPSSVFNKIRVLLPARVSGIFLFSSLFNHLQFLLLLPQGPRQLTHLFSVTALVAVTRYLCLSLCGPRPGGLLPWFPAPDQAGPQGAMLRRP